MVVGDGCANYVLIYLCDRSNVVVENKNCSMSELSYRIMRKYKYHIISINSVQ